LAGGAGGLAAWKSNATEQGRAAAANQPEPVDSITVALVEEHEHREVTSSIGTVLALRSIQLRNEEPGTVARVSLEPGRIVEEGELLVALDVSVEEAELRAREAQAALAGLVLSRLERANESQAVARMEVDRARAELDVAQAEIARIRAIIGRKTIVAPFRARVGMADVHQGQYLDSGTLLTTLQGVDDSVHVDFAVAQWVAAELSEGQPVDVFTSNGVQATPVVASIVAIDARVDPATRNAVVRARIWAGGAGELPSPGSSVRVVVPVGPAQRSAIVPVSALRKGPEGDHVFVVEPSADAPGRGRAHVRRVESGPMLGDHVVVRSGLEVGEVVAASGSFKLREGALVAFTDDPIVIGAAN
jgi:membrane fusion protein (multidrug efflux system)